MKENKCLIRRSVFNSVSYFICDSIFHKSHKGFISLKKALPKKCFFLVRVFIRDYLMVVFIPITIRADSDKKKLPSDKIFYLLSQRRGSVNLCNYLFVRIFIYNEFVFHRIKSLLFFYLSEEA